MIVSLAGSAGAPVPNPTADTANTSTPLATNCVSRLSADPGHRRGLHAARRSAARPPKAPAVAFIRRSCRRAVHRLAVNDGQRPASGAIPATNADAAEAVEN